LKPFTLFYRFGDAIESGIYGIAGGKLADFSTIGNGVD
jgi:hypothetical protein